MSQIKVFDHLNCGQTIDLCSTEMFEIKLPTNYSVTDGIYIYNHLTICKEMTESKFNCYCYMAILGIIFFFSNQ